MVRDLPERRAEQRVGCVAHDLAHLGDDAKELDGDRVGLGHPDARHLQQGAAVAAPERTVVSSRACCHVSVTSARVTVLTARSLYPGRGGAWALLRASDERHFRAEGLLAAAPPRALAL